MCRFNELEGRVQLLTTCALLNSRCFSIRGRWISTSVAALDHEERTTDILTLWRIEGETTLQMSSEFRFDEIGYWSEVKLEIQKEYAKAYSTILSAQKSPKLLHVYIDAFAGAGIHLTKQTKEFVPGSPLNALNVQPPFCEYHLIDIRPERVENLRDLVGNRQDVFLYEGDCNAILLERVFPRVLYRNYRRGLCILDPYGLDLSWSVIQEAGHMKTLDIFLNFPVADMNRNVLWRNPDKVDGQQKERMNAFWGDGSWFDAAYRSDPRLFEDIPEKQTNQDIAEAFRKRLRDVAGFARVPKPMPMRNSKGAIVYYLFFASQKDTAEKIVFDIFGKYKNWGAS
jgi:three-Cys-motif partner protein